jgi:GT2 family glycosyltransferase
MRQTCGLVLTTFNDLDISQKMYETLPGTLGPSDFVVVVDGGSDDGSIEFWESDHEVLTEKNTHRAVKHLSVALNVGIERCIQRGAKLICWIHADMKFNEDKHWLETLIKMLHERPDIGKLHPECVNDQHRAKGTERPGNNCPWVMKVSTMLRIDALRKERGGRHSNRALHEHEYFNEAYIGIGGREDWDLNNYVLDLGLKVLITPESVVWHEGMGTRKRRDTNPEANANAGLHQILHGTTGPRV